MVKYCKLICFYFLVIISTTLLISCSSYDGINLSFFPKSKINKKPLFYPKNQYCVGDSSKIYFTGYPNPFYDRSFIYFYNELKGTLYIKNTVCYEKDTLLSIYNFENEGAGLYTIEFINLEYGDYSMETKQRQEENRNKLGKHISSKWELFLDDTLRCYYTIKFNY